MGLFERLGRGVESFKQQAEDASEASASRQCPDCGEAVYADRPDCPECGSDLVTADTDADGSG